MQRLASLALVLVLGVSASAQITVWSGASTASDSTTGAWLTGEIHVIQGYVTVPQNETLTIQPGCIVKLDLNSSIWANGTLIANGTASNPIYFTSYRDDTVGGDTNGDGSATSPAPGNWAEVILNFQSSAHSLQHCEMRYGGSYGNAAITWAAPGGTVDHVNFRDMAWRGIIFGGAGRGDVTNCDFTNCRRPMDGVRPDQLHRLVNNTASNNSEGDVIWVDSLAKEIWGTRTWSTANMLNGTGALAIVGSPIVKASATLTITSGVLLKWVGTGSLLVEGLLITQGTPASPVIMTSADDDAHGGDSFNDGVTSATAGDWSGISYTFNGTLDLDGTEVWYAGGYGTTTAVTLGGTGGSIRNSVIARSEESGLNPGWSPTFTVDNVTFQNNAQFPIEGLGIEDLPNVTNCTASGNGSGDVVRISGGTLSGSLTLGTANSFNGTGVFAWAGTVNVAAAGDLTLSAGTIMKGDPTGSLARLNVYGTLTCNGSAGNEVVFTSMRDDAIGGDTNGDGGSTTPAPGDWVRVFLSYQSTTSSFTHTRFRYGANAMFQMDTGGDMTMSDCVIEDANGVGLDADGCAPTISNCAFDRCTSPLQGLDLASLSGLVGCTASGNTSGDVLRMADSQTYGAITLSAANTLNGSGVIVCDGGITITGGASLTLGAGMILKFTAGYHFSATGTIVCNGTAANPVVLTSHADDSHGGDSLGDGPTTGSPGDWGRLSISGPANVLTHTILRYGGAGTGVNQLEIGTSDATLTNCTSEYSLRAGLRMMSSGIAPTLTNCAFDNNMSRPIASMVFGNTVNMSGCTASGNAQPPVLLIHGLGTVPPGGLVISPAPTLNGNKTFLVGADVTMADTTIQAGTVLKFAAGKRMIFGGTNLQVNGTSADPVIFTSQDDGTHGNAGGTAAPGDWIGLEFQSAIGQIDNAWIGYAGSGGYAGMEFHNTTQLTLCEVTVQYCANEGIDLNGNSAPTLKQCSFLDNGSTAIEGLSWPALGKMSGTTASGNGGGQVDATWITSSWVDGHVMIERDNYFGTCVVVTTSPSISSGTSLTFGRGVVIKSHPGVELQVDSRGTGMEKVIMTSFKDDTIGGDTNGDGNASLPAPGDWIGCRDGDHEHALVRYAGEAVFGVTTPSLQSCTARASRVEYGAGAGFVAPTLGLTTYENCVAFQNAGSGFVSNWAVRNCTAVGNTTGIVALKTAYCVAWNNGTNYAVAGSNVQTSYGVVFSCGTDLGFGTPSNMPSCIWSGYGNINVDPKFVDEANGDLRLRWDSPCLNYVIPPISLATLCDTSICTPWGAAGVWGSPACFNQTAPYPEAPASSSDYLEFPRPLDDDDTGPNPLVADLGAHERFHYALLLGGETRLGTTPTYTVTGSPGTAVLVAGNAGAEYFVPNVGYLLMDPIGWQQLLTMSVGTTVGVPLPFAPALHGYETSIQGAIVNPAGILTAFTNVHRVRLHF